MKLLKDKYKLLEKTDEDEKVMLFLGQTVQEPVVNVDIRSLKKRWMQNPEFVQRYTQEFHTMATLDSPLFLKVYDIDFSNNIFFVATEHVEGKTIYDVIKDRMKLSLAQVINIITQISKALGHAMRENVKYRSLTYSDIMFSDNGKIKILKFHVPRNVSSPLGLESAKDSVAPVASQSSDIFFIGNLFYEILTFETLVSTASVRNVKSVKDFHFEAKNTPGLKPAQSESVKELIYKCVTSDMASRFQTIDELLAALVKFVQDQVNKTDVLTSMQVDPSKFKKNEKKETAENKAPSIINGTLGKSGAEKETAHEQLLAAPVKPQKTEAREKPSKNISDDPYDILFGKTRTVEPLKKGEFSMLNDEAAPQNLPGPEKNNENESETASFENVNGSPACTENTGKENIGPMWKNKKSGGSGIFAKLAGFWYTMLLMIMSFLGFVLYIFW